MIKQYINYDLRPHQEYRPVQRPVAGAGFGAGVYRKCHARGGSGDASVGPWDQGGGERV